MSRASDLHDQLAAVGIPVVTVRMSGTHAEVVYAPDATDEQRTQGEAIKDEFMALRGEETDL